MPTLSSLSLYFPSSLFHTLSLYLSSMWCLPSLKITNSALKSFAQVRLTALCVSRCCHRLLPPYCLPRPVSPTYCHTPPPPPAATNTQSVKFTMVFCFVFALECSYFFWEFAAVVSVAFLVVASCRCLLIFNVLPLFFFWHLINDNSATTTTKREEQHHISRVKRVEPGVAH